MQGTDATTGKPISGEAHLRQSVADILRTPIGSRLMRPDYGSRLFELVDAPMNRNTATAIYAAVAESLVKWEPRLTLQRTQITKVVPGNITLTITGQYLERPVTIKDLVV